MNAKTLLLAILALFLIFSLAEAAKSDAKSLPPKKTVRPPKKTIRPKAPPSEYIPAQEAKKAAKKLKNPVPTEIPSNAKEVPKDIPKTRDEL